MEIKAVYNYTTPLPVGVKHTEGMPEGWITYKYDGFTVTECPLKFIDDGDSTGNS